MGHRRIADRLRFAGGLRQQRPLLQVKPLQEQAAESQPTTAGSEPMGSKVADTSATRNRVLRPY